MTPLDHIRIINRGVIMQRFTLRLTDEIHEKLRWLAYKEKRSQQSIIMELLEDALADVEVPQHEGEGDE